MGIWTQQKVNCREKVSRAMMILIIIWLFVEFAKKKTSHCYKSISKKERNLYMIWWKQQRSFATWLEYEEKPYHYQLLSSVRKSNVPVSNKILFSCNYFYTHQASGFLWLGLFILPLGCFLVYGIWNERENQGISNLFSFHKKTTFIHLVKELCY